MKRPTAMSRVLATGRVPFDLIPVTAATAATSTASPSQKIQVCMGGSFHEAPTRRRLRGESTPS